MPATNPLSFLRPLYDIAVWQFILMCGYTQKEDRRLKFTWKMHEVVANFLCKLLEVRAFDHLQSKLISEEVKTATGNWEVGQRASRKLVEWCQDQWRRKDPCPPRSDQAYAENEPSTLPWFNNIPVCHNCGVPCPSCRSELASELPLEMSTARAILCFDDIHKNINKNSGDDDRASKEAEECPPSPQVRMQLRSRKRIHDDSSPGCSNTN